MFFSYIHFTEKQTAFSVACRSKLKMGSDIFVLIYVWVLSPILNNNKATMNE